ncbi:MAG TPA: radical SAM protein [Thermodesulfovibrionales bacterium]|nr:radical SAM protein [Thermodesulfovibrionales bacterium]
MTSGASYLALSSAKFEERVERAWEMLRRCALCPRECGVDRTAGELGFCNAGTTSIVSSWGSHFGEEKPLVGRFGSGTIFFSRCNLGCVFCQNWTISHLGEGKEISFEKLARIMRELQDSGCHNINLVTPTHQMPMILRALALAKNEGLNIPIVYNCGGYESVNALRILDGIVDIYMPDFKYSDPKIALKYSKATNYPESAKAAIREMHAQVGDLKTDERGIAIRGLLVRHLVLPGNAAGTKEVVRFIAEEISRDTYINIMNQYHPCYKASEHPSLDRRITADEYDAAVKTARDAGLRRIDGATKNHLNFFK